MKPSLPTLLIVGFLLALPIGSCTYATGTVQEGVEFTVSDKERVNGSESSTYLVFTEGETFRVGDSLWHGKFAASDHYGRLKPGVKYRAKVYGWRVPIFSMYRNVIEVEEVSE